MKTDFAARLCRRGIPGGALHLDGDTLTYMTRDYARSERPRALALPVSDIAGLAPCRHFLLPAVKLYMHSGKTYKFVVYDREVFMNVLKDRMTALAHVEKRMEYIA